jgi:hypothetical protein
MSKFIILSKLSSDRYDAEEGEPPRTQPSHINVEAIRCFYARRNNEPGSRITFTDGGGYAVLELPDAIRAMIDGTEPAVAAGDHDAT